MRTTTLACLGSLCALAACGDPTRPTTDLQKPVAPPNGAAVWLEVSPQRPAVGDTVMVVVRAATDGPIGPVGAYVAEIHYLPARLLFAASRPDVSGMTAHNAREPGRLRMAGAAATGFEHGALFVATFVAIAPDAASDLHLTVQQLYADSRRDLLPGAETAERPRFRARPGPLSAAPRF